MTARLTRAELEALAEARLPRAGDGFDLTEYHPPGPVAQAYIRSTGPIDAIMGPGGSGKTVASIFKAIRFCTNTMPICQDGRVRAKITVVRDNYRSLYRTTMQSWFQWFPVEKHPEFFGGQDRPARHELRIETFRPWKGENRRIPVDITAEFFAIADVNYELLFKSYETSIAWATEADGVPPEAIPFFYSRTARYPSLATLPEGTRLPRLAMVDMNPPDPEHPLLAACERGSFREDFKADLEPRAINFFKQPGGLSPGAENRLGKPREAYEEEARVLPKDQARRMVHGLPGRVKDGLPVYDDDFDRDLHVSATPLAILPGLPIHAGLDQGGQAGGAGQPAICFFQVSPEGQVRVLAEVATKPGTGVERFVAAVKPLLHGPLRGLPPGVWTIDPAGFMGGDKQWGTYSWAEIFSQSLGVRLIPAPTQEWPARLDAVGNRLRLSIRAQTPALIIDPGCITLIRGLSTGFKFSYRHDKTIDPRPTKNIYANICEALQYGLLGFYGLPGVVSHAVHAGRAANVVGIREGQPVVQGADWRVFE